MGREGLPAEELHDENERFFTRRVQLHEVEGYDLARLTGRLGPFSDDPELCECYYSLVRAMASGDGVDSADATLLLRLVKQTVRDDSVLYQRFRDDFTNKPERRALNDFLAGHGIPTSRDDRGALARALFQIGPLGRCMSRHGKPLLREFRKRGMLGDRKLPERDTPVLEAVPFTPAERELSADPEDYVNELRVKLMEAFAGDARAKIAVGFYLTFLRRRFASSHFAILQTLRRRLEKMRDLEREPRLSKLDVDQVWPAEPDDIDPEEEGADGDEASLVERVPGGRTVTDVLWEIGRLTSLIAAVEALGGMSSKQDAFLSRILAPRRMAGNVRQFIVFSQFYDTARDLFDRVVSQGGVTCALYSGAGCWIRHPGDDADVPVMRDHVRERFVAGEIGMLVCTDAAAEGLNLQTADLLVQYDLPWNPTKAEQRIGRIDRIGSKHDRISVVNLCYQEGVEAQVYDVLARRLAKIFGILGSQEDVLLPLSSEDFEALANCHAEADRAAQL